jgi:CRP/FNR family transcriptional regulator, cyclic AMP receptor protein
MNLNLQNLFNNTKTQQTFEAGTVIFAEGDRADSMYVVLDGELDVWVGSNLLEVIGPGGIIGEMALIDRNTRSATAVAKSTCRLALVDEKRFQFMVHETPYFALHVMRVMAERLRRMNVKLTT